MLSITDEKIDLYAGEHSDPEPAVLSDLSRETQANVLMPRMLSGHLQGTFLRMITSVSKAKSILEIGTYTGYSAIAMAMGLPEDGKLQTIDINDELKTVAEKYIRKAGLEHKIKTWWDDATSVIPKLNGPFDLVFIDADKTNYSRYYDLVFDKVNTGGLIIADNVLWSGKVLETAQDHDTAALQQFNKKVRADKRVEKMMLTLRDGLMIVRKK